MSRKSLILCLSLLAVMVVGLGTAIALLYSGTGDDRTETDASFNGARACFAAVPSDAVAVSCFSRMDDACSGVLSGFGFPSAFADGLEDGTLASLKKSHMAVSLHYSGKLSSLYIIDVSRASDLALSGLTSVADSCGMYSVISEGFFIASESEPLVKSSLRHKDKNVSVADAPGFSEAMSSVSGTDLLLISHLQAKKLMTAMFTSKVSRHASFVERAASWSAYDISSGMPLSLKGSLLYEGDANEFLTVFEDCRPSVTAVASVLPSFTIFALTLPIDNLQSYISAYQSFVDSGQGLQEFKMKQNSLGKTAGVMPEEFFTRLAVKELASASFVSGGNVERINLIRVGEKDVQLIFKDTGVTSLRGYAPAVHTWAYPSFVASVFGKYFALEDESCFTFIDGWIITGSRQAISEYVSNKALDYTLEEYLADAGKPSLLENKSAVALAYFSLTESKDRLPAYFKPEMQKVMSSMIEDCDCVPVVFALTKEKKPLSASLDMYSLTLQKTKAPAFDRDTVVVVPSGPFQVKNSHTGKMNTFYQNAQKSLCLRDENGKDLWGVPFGKPLCGTAQNVDCYANGKLQIIFASGSSIYVIDRLGRYVSGYPLNLGKEIVLGPDVYDFSGARRYNIMVLHKDNTVQMYNLKGKMPEAWKGITAGETIKALPERLKVGNKDFWIVRTSIQTLIYPFYGGEPLTVFEGNSMIRPDSEVKPVDGTSVQVVNYDGKTKTIKLVK